MDHYLGRGQSFEVHHIPFIVINNRFINCRLLVQNEAISNGILFTRKISPPHIYIRFWSRISSSQFYPPSLDYKLLAFYRHFRVTQTRSSQFSSLCSRLSWRCSVRFKSAVTNRKPQTYFVPSNKTSETMSVALAGLQIGLWLFSYFLRFVFASLLLQFMAVFQNMQNVVFVCVHNKNEQWITLSMHELQKNDIDNHSENYVCGQCFHE